MKFKTLAKSPSKPITEHLAYLLAQANREINRQLDARFRKVGVGRRWGSLNGDGYAVVTADFAR